jgi:hypothetical protein
VQLSTPEVASAPAKATLTPWLYHPLESGDRAGLALTVGAVASYFNENEPGALTLPATSRHVPATAAAALSGPPYVGRSQPAIPEVASLPLNVTVTGALNQPLPFAPRSGAAPVTAGGVLSILTIGVEVFVPSWLLTVQVCELSVPSWASVYVSQPDEAVSPLFWKLTVTLLTYQPFAPAVPETTA